MIQNWFNAFKNIRIQTPSRQVRGQPLPGDAEDLGEFWARTDAAWNRVLTEAAPVAAALVSHCRGLGPEVRAARRAGRRAGRWGCRAGVWVGSACVAV